jgi:hypothetical protein
MGRYYSGDIEGKFWFALQSSTAADRFGSTGYEPSYIEYNFYEEHLEGVQAELKRIEDKLGDKLQVIDKFFEENNGYTDEKLEKAGITRSELSEYADYGLGKKIEQCIISTGQCEFTAEL